ncbi:MAG: GNAT family N-acetyltransferase [Acidobacteriaceae bacterium]
MGNTGTVGSAREPGKLDGKSGVRWNEPKASDPGMTQLHKNYDEPLAEFFVLRGYRRRGIGTHMAHEIWRRLLGAREVRVMQSNVAANHFWADAVSTFAGERVDPIYTEKGDECWAVYRFTSEDP